MIRRVRLGSFKRFRDQSFELDDSIVLAGPNNAGKSTLLQAIATWKFGLDYWVAQREGGSKSVKRTGVAVTRRDFTAVPISEMNLLWKDRVVSGGEGPGASRLLVVVVDGQSNDENWECGLEFQYANREMVYVRPARCEAHGGGRDQRVSPGGGQRPPSGARPGAVWHTATMSPSTNGACRICSLARAAAATSCGTCYWRSAARLKRAGAPMLGSRPGSP